MRAKSYWRVRRGFWLPVRRKSKIQFCVAKLEQSLARTRQNETVLHKVARMVVRVVTDVEQLNERVCRSCSTPLDPWLTNAADAGLTRAGYANETVRLGGADDGIVAARATH
jgi:hypothetical protein